MLPSGLRSVWTIRLLPNAYLWNSRGGVITANVFFLACSSGLFFFFPAKASTLKMCKWPRSDPTACWASHYGFSMSFYIPGLVRGNAKLEFEMKEGKELTFAKYLPWTKHCACCLTHDILFNPLNKLLNCVLSLTPYHEEIEAIRSLFLFTYLFLFF